MAEQNPESETLISFTTALSGELLECIRTSTGKAWADVTRKEAVLMVQVATVLDNHFTDAEIWDAGLEGIVDDGRLAEGLLGPLQYESPSYPRAARARRRLGGSS
jgi:hypothetical protein